ncbi:hypothetical protein GUJ93_ZPchr0005g16218 [Zizania palustris]|uniref:Uncharacterized protein n=1 Tax=Zizania palustris TaxID=103762 RepID=A0A8J5SM99_ZIZPA|nr:hypothetical protein GUJ93_ZPchr0005g16218 [Zizania palustris]
MGSSSSNNRAEPPPPPPPPPTPTPPALSQPLHTMDADEEDVNVKQLSECAALYLSLQDCLVESNRNWKACQAQFVVKWFGISQYLGSGVLRRIFRAVSDILTHPPSATFSLLSPSSFWPVASSFPRRCSFQRLCTTRPPDPIASPYCEATPP